MSQNRTNHAVKADPVDTPSSNIGDRVAWDLRNLPGVLTSREAATFLRVGVREVRALVDSGQLPGVRFGPRRVIRISRAAVLALLNHPPI